MASSEFSDVFVSYRRKDVEFTKQIVGELKKAGKEVWVDWEDIPPGSEGFTDDIKRGLEGSDAFLCILSPNYLESTYCVDMELGYALELKKKIIPVVLEKFENHPVPAGIGHINWIYFTPHAGQANTFEQSFPKITQALDQDLAHARMHKRIALRALEWDSKSRSRSYLLSGDEISEAEDWIRHANDKTPEATALHADYIAASRRYATQRQRQLLAGVSVALVVSLILMVVAVVMGFEANNQRIRAEDNEQIAVRQADISQSIALASGAMEANTRDQIQAVALAVESVKITDPPGIGQRVLGTVAYQPGAVRLFNGHTSFVTAVVFSPDGKTAVSSAEDTSLIVWDVATGEILHTLTGHTKSVDDVAFSPDGKMIASAAEDKTIKLWDAATGTELRTLEGHNHWVLSVAFSPDSQKLVSSSRDETIIVWDTQTGEILQNLEGGHTDRATAVEFSPDGKLIASASRDDTIILWDADTGSILYTLTGHTADISSISFSPDSTLLASGGYDNTVRLWDTATGQPIRSFVRHTRAVTTVAFSPDGQSLFSGSDDRTIIWWDLEGEAKDPIHIFTGQEFLRSVAPSPDGQALLSADRTPDLILWDLQAGNVIHTLANPEGAINGVAFSPDGQLVAAATDDQLVLVYEAAAGASRYTLTGHENYVNAVAFSPDGRWLASGDESNTVRIWDLNTGETVYTLTEDQPIHSLAFTPDGQNLLVGSGVFVDGSLNLWDIETETRLTEFTGFAGSVWGVAISPDGVLAASASEDGLRLWELATGKLLRELNGHTAAVRSVAFSPDNTKLLSGSFDNQMLLWDVATGSLLQTFAGHSEVIRSVAFNPDTRLVASGSDDDTVMIWDTLTGDAISTYTGHHDRVNSIAFSADGKQLISGSLDSQVIIWRVNTLNELMEWTAANRYLADLDCITRREYGLECHEQRTQ